MKKQRKQDDLDYKRRIVQEYLAGATDVSVIAQRAGPERDQIDKWRVQVECRDRISRIEQIADTEDVSVGQARRISELEAAALGSI